MKKILLTLLLFVGLFVMAGCGKTSAAKISNPDELYVNVTEGEFSYNLTNSQVYQLLKKQLGTNVLLDMIDRDLLKSLPKGNSNYWDSITDTQVTEAFEKEAFPSGKANLSASEIAKITNDYMESLYINYGLLTQADVNDFYRLTLAKKLYATDQVLAKYSETDFKDEDYQNYFNNNYKKGFYAIVVSYESQKLLEDAMKQLGVKISNSVWQTLSGIALTEQEIVKVFIDLYNMNNSYKLPNYPEVGSTVTLRQGFEYSLQNGNIAFNLDQIPMLKYTNAEIYSYQPEIQTLLADRLTSYPNSTWYTKDAKIYKNGARYSLVMEIGEIETQFNDVKSAIREKLVEAEVTNNYIADEIIKLRQNHKILFYDNDLESGYVKIVEGRSLEFKKSRKTSSTLVAKTDVKEYTADELFEEMSRNYGIMITTSKIETQRFLRNTNLNKIYNVNTKEVLNESKWNTIKQQVTDEKQNFKDDLYAEYGYPASYGWENFIRDIYGVFSEEELLEYYLYLEVKDAYAKSLGDLSNVDTSSGLWQFYLRNMEAVANRYFNVSGIHLLIHVANPSGTTVKPAEYTANQKLMAEEFYRQVMAYLKAETVGTYEERLQAVVDAFNRAPRFLPGTTQTTDAQTPLAGAPFTFKGIEISKFKTAGLSVKFENLGTFKNDRMVTEFDNAVRSIWQANPSSSVDVVYGQEPNAQNEWTYLVTQFGYHVYVNLDTYPLDKWSDTEVLPTLEQIKKYLADKTTKELTDKVKTAITTYYSPIYSELIGSSNFSIQSYKALRTINFNFSHDDFTNEQYFKYLDIRIAKTEANLKFKS